MKRMSSFLLTYGVAIFILTSNGLAEVTKVEIAERSLIEEAGTQLRYESITGTVHYTLDPSAPANQAVVDLDYAPRNSLGLVEYSADFRLLIPPAEVASDVLLYNVNNRGGSRFPPEISLTHPLSGMGYSYLATGWINEIAPRDGRLRLHAPVVTDGNNAITGEVRYEVTVGTGSDEVNIAGNGHLAYQPTASGQRNARLTRREYQDNPRIPIERSQFELSVQESGDSTQPTVMLKLEGGFQPGVIYELIYEAQNPVLAGAGMAAIRDLVALIKRESQTSPTLASLSLPPISKAVAWGNSQSGRLLRQFIYDGFNADLVGNRVFDGIIPVIAGGGYGMFNLRFAMPTRTNGQHSNYLYPNDLFPFTYGESTDPFTGRKDSVLAKARETDSVPKIMHIQTSNEYWVRAGSLPHTNPAGTVDANIPAEVRFYTIGGSQHGSGNGMPRPTSTGQLPPNPNMWAPFSYSLIQAMVEWVKEGAEPPESRYPRIADGSLVPAHKDGSINSQAWNAMVGINHPTKMYQPAFAEYGGQWQEQRIIGQHPSRSNKLYQALVPAVDRNNNDLIRSTILPPLTQVPLATFVSWNLRAVQTGSEKSLARLAGGYIPLGIAADSAARVNDSRQTLAELYSSFENYLEQYEKATDTLIQQRYLLPAFKGVLMNIARANQAVFR